MMRSQTLPDILDTEKLEAHIKQGNVNVQRHPHLPLRIYNYSHQAQYDQSLWGDGVIDYCRGLIVDDNNVIVARPFKKFWNLNTPHAPESMHVNLPKVPPTVLEKLDGSLGIYWKYEFFYGVATRGSFTSIQSIWATNWVCDHILKKAKRYSKIEDLGLFFPEDYTALFEIIYPENRIVCKYDYEGLVLLGMVHKLTGYELPHSDLVTLGEMNGLQVVKQHDKTLAEAVLENEYNREGYVLNYPTTGIKPPIKVKVKFPDYVRLHRIVTGINPKAIWELLSTGAKLDFLEESPEHFKAWAAEWILKFTDSFQQLKTLADYIYINRPIRYPGCTDRYYRKECAAYFQKKAPTVQRPL
jgi:RNA ligase